MLSLPSRERGLKYQVYAQANHLKSVAPLAGAWIEIQNRLDEMEKYYVAPLAGAWIEIKKPIRCQRSRIVAPLAGAWIEITGSTQYD